MAKILFHDGQLEGQERPTDKKSLAKAFEDLKALELYKEKSLKQRKLFILGLFLSISLNITAICFFFI